MTKERTKKQIRADKEKKIDKFIKKARKNKLQLKNDNEELEDP